MGWLDIIHFIFKHNKTVGNQMFRIHVRNVIFNEFIMQISINRRHQHCDLAIFYQKFEIP